MRGVLSTSSQVRFMGTAVFEFVFLVAEEYSTVACSIFDCTYVGIFSLTCRDMVFLCCLVLDRAWVAGLWEV